MGTKKRAWTRQAGAAMSDEETQFESADAGASDTIPVTAGSVRKGGHIVIKGKPCKVIDISTSKTGKHGHAKCKFVALNIFTGAKQEDMQPSSHNCEVPNVGRKEYSLLDIDDEGFLSLMADDGSTKDDLKLPSGSDDSNKLADEIQKEFDAEKDLVLNVLSAMGEEMVSAMKIATS